MLSQSAWNLASAYAVGWRSAYLLARTRFGSRNRIGWEDLRSSTSAAFSAAIVSAFSSWARMDLFPASASIPTGVWKGVGDTDGLLLADFARCASAVASKS